MYAKVLIDIKAKSLNRLFDYKIPDNLKDDINIGDRVIVPFNHQKRLGFVIEIINESNLANKNIIENLDVLPTISKESFLYLNYLKETNKTLLINILETILPSELFISYEQYISLNNIEDINKLSNELKLLFNNKKEIKYTNKLKDYKKEINQLVNEDVLTHYKKYQQKGKRKTINVVKYNKDHKPYNRINNYIDLIEFVKTNDNNNLVRNDIVSKGFSLSSINTLIKHEVFVVKEKEVYREITFKDTNKIKPHKLTHEQEIAYEGIKKSFNTNDIVLLHGITGSGKTEVYMHLIKDILLENKKVLFLVPEITLIAPTINYFKSRFNIEITHYNSNLSKGERYDSWLKIVNDEAKIIVGTRSSSFLPIKDLGLIIVDEEHDNSYNQTERVQYNLIDILKIKSKFNNAPIILGSATPKINSMYKALNKEYKLYELKNRATNKPLPKIHLVDMKEELLNGNTSIFSKLLKDKINEKLKKDEQIILLYNRKGYASFILCRTCGFVNKCPNCDISLTYYKNDNTLRCSYCNYKETKQTACSSCGSNKIGEVGLGIEQIYEIVRHTFKDSKVLIMDERSTRTKGSHEQKWLDFKNQKYNILVGTQMVSKGLDFKNVTLVGVLMADLELSSPNYLAKEHTYNLLTQMVGRSGRSLAGEAIIQGYKLDNPAIKLIDKPYKLFYKDAIYQREIMKYEPFYEMSQILVKNKSYLKSYTDAFKLKKALEGSGKIVLGPTEPIIKYIKGEYRFVITIKDKKMNYKEIFNKIENLKTDSIINFIKIPEII